MTSIRRALLIVAGLLGVVFAVLVVYDSDRDSSAALAWTAVVLGARWLVGVARDYLAAGEPTP